MQFINLSVNASARRKGKNPMAATEIIIFDINKRTQKLLFHCAEICTGKCQIKCAVQVFWLREKVNTSRSPDLIGPQQARERATRVYYLKRGGVALGTLEASCPPDWRLQLCLRTTAGQSISDHKRDKRMIKHHLKRLILLNIIFCATRTPSYVKGAARDFDKKGNLLSPEVRTRVMKNRDGI